jgi:hypothetical protein
LHFSSAIFGKYIETPLLSSYESIHIEVCFLECCESIAEPDQLVGPFDSEFDLRAIHLAVVDAKEPGVMASSAKRILHQQTRKSIAESTSSKHSVTWGTLSSLPVLQLHRYQAGKPAPHGCNGAYVPQTEYTRVETRLQETLATE